MSSVKAREPLRDGFERLAYMGGSRLVAAILGLVAATLIARHLTPADLGIWAMALAVQGYALHLGEFGLRSVVTAEMPALKSSGGVLLKRYLKLRLTLSVAAMVLIAIGSAVLVPDRLHLMMIVGLSVPVIALMVDWVPLVQGRHQVASMLLLTRPLLFCLGLAAVSEIVTPELVALLFLLAWIGAAAMSWMFLGHQDACANSSALAAPGDRALLHLGWPLMLVTLTNQALMSADLLMVGLIVGTAAAGQFYLAGAVAVAGLVFANAGGQLALARLARWRNRPDLWLQALKRELRTSLIVGGAAGLGLVVLTPVIIPRLFGPDYAPAAMLLPWFAPWLVLQHASAILQAGLTTTRKRRVLLEANIAAMIVMALGLAILFLIGIQALAVTTVLAAMALLRAVSEAAKTVILWEAVVRFADAPAVLSAGSSRT